MSDLERYMVQGYLPTIGIECHVQLKTKTKLFSGVSNDARDAAPNSLISHICLGMPGALPVLNKRAVELSCRAAFALNTTPQKFSKFDRKHYFYPDLPKGYQITQFDEPIILGGSVKIEVDSETQTIGITRAHIEEDAGKSSHPPGQDYSLVDLNRAGTPLLEIVSEPDMHSAKQARQFARELYLLMKYAEVSDVDLYHGNMRFDVNVSVSKDPKELGTRSETKNLNSFRSVQKAVEYEIDRQIGLLEKSGVIVQETRGWDDAKQKTFSQRSKEDAHDYRYFPEPDVPPVILTDSEINAIKETMPVTHVKLRKILHELNLDGSTVETIVEQLPAGRFILSIAKSANKLDITRIANWLASDIQALVSDKSLDWNSLRLSEKPFLQLCQMVNNNEINSSAAKTVLLVMVQEDGDPLTIAKEKNILQVSDESAIEAIVAQVLADNPKAAADVKNGEDKAVGFLVGQVMKESKGQANPAMAQSMIRKQLSI